jgi:uncharacterized protein (DUF1697 family)
MRCVALIRGINVGKSKRISMAELGKLCTSLGFSNVRTLLNSGNVVFEAPRNTTGRLSASIEAAIAGTLGVKIVVAVVTSHQLKKIIDENPMLQRATDFSRHFIAFGSDKPAFAPVKSLLQQPWLPDALALTPQAAYLWCEAGAIDSKLSQAFSRKAGAALTLRNWATVLKIQALMAESP